LANPNLTPTEIQPSKPVKTELFEKVRVINDDVESRLTDQENTSSSLPVFSAQVSISNPTAPSPDLVIELTPAFKNSVTLTSSNLVLLEKSVAYLDDAVANGLEIDVQKSAGGVLDADFTTSIYTVKPFIDFITAAAPAAGDSNTGTFDAGQINIAAGERLRLVLTGVPANQQLIRFIFELFI
jgi:hypothetical protein